MKTLFNPCEWDGLWGAGFILKSCSHHAGYGRIIFGSWLVHVPNFWHTTFCKSGQKCFVGKVWLSLLRFVNEFGTFLKKMFGHVVSWQWRHLPCVQGLRKHGGFFQCSHEINDFHMLLPSPPKFLRLNSFSRPANKDALQRLFFAC